MPMLGSVDRLLDDDEIPHDDVAELIRRQVTHPITYRSSNRSTQQYSASHW